MSYEMNVLIFDYNSMITDLNLKCIALRKQLTINQMFSCQLIADSCRWCCPGLVGTRITNCDQHQLNETA